MAPLIDSVSPRSGPPGTAVTITGAGFDAGSQVGCPTLVATTVVDETTVKAAIPADMLGAGGTSLVVGVYVRNADGSVSHVVPFTVLFPAEALQTWTTIEAVIGEVPGFARGGQIGDDQIRTWMRSVAQAIAGAMLRRGLPTDPAGWTQQGADGTPAAIGVLELINRVGSASRLAAAIAAQWSSGEWGLAKNLERAYDREMQAMARGDYDKLFRPSAATVESGPLLAAGDMTDDDGCSSAAFTKGKVF